MNEAATMKQATDDSEPSTEPTPGGPQNESSDKSQKRGDGRPSQRDRGIYERHVLRGETQETIAADQGCSRQRVSQICRKIERWLATNPDDEMAAALRLRCQRRLDVLYRAAIRQFQRSKQDLVTERERTSHRVPDDKPEKAVTTTVHERVRRQQNGDARFLNAALRAVERMAAVCAEPRAEGARGRQGDGATGRYGEGATGRQGDGAYAGQGDGARGRQGDGARGRQGDGATGRQGEQAKTANAAAPAVVPATRVVPHSALRIPHSTPLPLRDTVPVVGAPKEIPETKHEPCCSVTLNTSQTQAKRLCRSLISARCETYGATPTGGSWPRHNWRPNWLSAVKRRLPRDGPQAAQGRAPARRGLFQKVRAAFAGSSRTL